MNDNVRAMRAYLLGRGFGLGLEDGKHGRTRRVRREELPGRRKKEMRKGCGPN